MRAARTGLWLAACALFAGCASTSLTVAGDAAIDGRLFVQPSKYPGQQGGSGASLVAEPSAKLQLDDASTFEVQPFYRLDPVDARRSHFDLRQASYRLSLEHFEASAGVGTFTWGALESHRPGDVMNQHDFVDSLSESVKLGQLFVEVGWVGESWSLRAYELPFSREETFPGSAGRLRFPLVIDTDHPQYESKLGPWQPSGAVRGTLNLGDVDLGASLFTGNSREPRFVLALTSGQIVPRYDVMQQASVDAQYNLGALNLKAEGFVRLWTMALTPFGGAGVGFDYTFFHLVSDADLSIAAEFLVDTRPVGAPVTFFDHDAFVGFRLAVNDVASTEVSGGVVVDVRDASVIARLEVSRRFGDHWRAYAGANYFHGAPTNLVASFARDSYAAARLAYFF
ncbi:MAG: hypothetical protein QM723_03490 [Myxococcaceae bacterium]